jgi:hypothetical protein
VGRCVKTKVQETKRQVTSVRGRVTRAGESSADLQVGIFRPADLKVSATAARQEPAPPKGNVAQGSLSSPPILMADGFPTAP